MNLEFKVLNFNVENDTNFIFDRYCFDNCYAKLNEFINRGLYGQLNPINTINNIQIIDRTFCSHKIVNYEIIDNILIVEVLILPNINGIAILECKKYNISLKLCARLIIQDYFELKSKKIRINSAEIITFDIFTS